MAYLSQHKLSDDDAPLGVTEIVALMGLLYLTVVTVLIVATATLDASAFGGATEFVDWTYGSFTA